VGVAPTDGSLNLLAIGIKKKFVVIKTMALLGGIRAIHPVCVQLTGTYFWQVTVPDHVSLLGKRGVKRLTFPRNIEQTKLHFLGVL
jgi:hypothetical protein